MAMDYAKVLTALGAEYKVIGRGAASAQRFKTALGVDVFEGGLAAALQLQGTAPRAAIVSVGVEALAETSIRLLEAEAQKLLVEKPAAINIAQLKDLQRASQVTGATVFVAYNRRFYASTLHAKKMIEEDGGLLSCNFEFTEWGHETAGLQKAPGVMENWFLSNSTHVVDLAFHLAGDPVDLSSYTAGSLDWHPRSSVFAGAGVTDRGVLFSYQANWGAPGRWGVEALTANHRLIGRST